MAKKKETKEEKIEREMLEQMAAPLITEEEININEAKDIGRLEGENLILKQILEQKLEIQLIPKFSNGFA